MHDSGESDDLEELCALPNKSSTSNAQFVNNDSMIKSLNNHVEHKNKSKGELSNQLLVEQTNQTYEYLFDKEEEIDDFFQIHLTNLERYDLLNEESRRMLVKYRYLHQEHMNFNEVVKKTCNRLRLQLSNYANEVLLRSISENSNNNESLVIVTLMYKDDFVTKSIQSNSEPSRTCLNDDNNEFSKVRSKQKKSIEFTEQMGLTPNVLQLNQQSYDSKNETPIEHLNNSMSIDSNQTRDSSFKSCDLEVSNEPSLKKNRGKTEAKSRRQRRHRKRKKNSISQQLPNQPMHLDTSSESVFQEENNALRMNLIREEMRFLARKYNNLTKSLNCIEFSHPPQLLKETTKTRGLNTNSRTFFDEKGKVEKEAQSSKCIAMNKCDEFNNVLNSCYHMLNAEPNNLESNRKAQILGTIEYESSLDDEGNTINMNLVRKGKTKECEKVRDLSKSRSSPRRPNYLAKLYQLKSPPSHDFIDPLNVQIESELSEIHSIQSHDSFEAKSPESLKNKDSKIIDYPKVDDDSLEIKRNIETPLKHASNEENRITID